MKSTSAQSPLARLRVTQRGRRVALYTPLGILGLLVSGCGGSSPFTLPSMPSMPSFSMNSTPTSTLQASAANGDQPVGTDHLQAARHHEAQGNWQEATRHYEAALQAQPGHARTLVAYARMLDRQEQFEQAERVYREALRWEPQNAAIYNDLGLCQARAGRLDASLQSLDQAVRLQPSEVRFRNNIAKVLVEVGRHEDGLQHLAAVHPPAIAHHNLAYFLQGKQEVDLATRHFTRAMELDPSLMQGERIQATAGTAGRPGAPSPTQDARPRSYAAAQWQPSARTASAPAGPRGAGQSPPAAHPGGSQPPAAGYYR